MKKISLNLLLSFISLFFVSCGSGGSDNNSTDTTFNKEQKDFLYKLFKTEYLWYDKVLNINYDNYQHPQKMINALSYNYDRWSFYETLNDYYNFINQKKGGFGCYFKNNKIYRMDYNSPCEKAGLKRGDILIKLNNERVNYKAYKQAKHDLKKINIFTVKRKNTILNIKIIPDKYKFRTTKYQIFEGANNIKIGHLIFNSFTPSSADELNEAFSYFKSNKVKELIIDLRYNGGGSSNISSILMDKIAGYNHENKLQRHIKWNDNYSKNDEYFYFEKDKNSLDLKRVFFLITNKTASASESVINSLKPYMDVKLIGSRTHGKLVGMQGKRKNGLIYWLINYSINNANAKGKEFYGFDVDCYVEDNYEYQRTDKNEKMLKKALNFIENESCQ